MKTQTQIDQKEEKLKTQIAQHDMHILEIRKNLEDYAANVHAIVEKLHAEKYARTAVYLSLAKIKYPSIEWEPRGMVKDYALGNIYLRNSTDGEIREVRKSPRKDITVKHKYLHTIDYLFPSKNGN